MTIKASMRRLFAVTIITCLAAPQTLWAQQAIDDSPCLPVTPARRRKG